MSTKIESNFNLPIFYNEKKQNIRPNIKDDLELCNFKDNSNNCLYSYVLNPKTEFGKKNLAMWSEYYTTDKDFLKDSQNFYKMYKPINNDYEAKNKICNKVEDIWNNIRNDSGFKEKYNYIDWKFFQKLNSSAYFLQLLSLYNLTSPLFSLIMPLILLIVPFFLLKFQKANISFSSYVGVLKKIFQHHAVGKLFSEFSNVSWDKRVYILVSVLFYFLQIYQNVITCIRFYRNMYTIHDNIFLFRDYIDYTLTDMKNILSISNKLPSYNLFSQELRYKISTLEGFLDKFNEITPCKFNIKKCSQIGSVMKYYYEIYSDDSFQSAFNYSIGFNAFSDQVHGFTDLIKSKYINKCSFSSKKTKMTKAYYPPLMYDKPVKNNISLSKKLIITGPNAAGKTTILKATIFNIILSQQTGYGFYDKANIVPYNKIHCYLNIPDTSGRDSLFQAEAKRCKEILDSIAVNPNEKHFCIFDELYSGTNPYEAIASAYSFIDYLTKNKNVHFLLTTHYIKLCDILNKNECIKNSHMKIKKTENNNFIYTYKLSNNVSSIKGGLKVLYNLKYPDSIIENAEKTLNIFIVIV